MQMAWWNHHLYNATSYSPLS